VLFRSLVINTKQPYPVWLYRAEVGSAALPEAYYTRVGQAAFSKKPIGVGAYKFVSLELGQRTVLTAFDDYHLGAPQVKDLVLLPIPEPATKMAMLKAGEADMIDNVTGAQSAELKGDASYRLITSRYADSYAMQLMDFLDNDPSKPVMNLKVRQAMAYAIDRKALVERVYFGNAETAAAFLNPLVIGHNPDLKPYAYDVTKAKQLMREAGYPTGFDMEYTTSAGDQTLPLALKGYLREIGINVKITIIDAAQFPSLLTQKKLRGAYTRAAPPLAFADGQQVLWLLWLKIGTWGGWEDDTIMGLFRKVEIETDLTKRVQLLREADAYMYQQLPGIPLVHINALFAVNKKIDFRPTPGNYNAEPLRRLTWMPGY
jgi:peptide/nickel transport system substrate-binding protein